MAKDPERMRAVFAGYLPRVLPGGLEIRDCRVLGLKYEPAWGGRCRRCMVRYELRLGEPEQAASERLWLTGVTYDSGRRRLVAGRLWLERLAAASWELRRRWSRSPSRAPSRLTTMGPRFPALTSSFHVPRLGLQVSVFPHDRRLPALARIVDRVPSELDAPLADRAGAAGLWRAQEWQVEPVRYWSESRATLRLTLRARDGSARETSQASVYLKAFRERHTGAHTDRVLRALAERAATDPDRFAVGEPIAYLSGLRTLVQEEIPGPTVLDLLRKGADPFPLLSKIARALSLLHLDHPVASRRRPIGDFARDVELWGRQLREARLGIEARVDAVVARAVGGLAEVAVCPSHGDLGLGHICLDGGRLVLLDLDEFAEGDPLLDVARLLTDVFDASLPWRFGSSAARAPAHAFAEEYFARVPEAWRPTLPPRLAGTLIRRAVLVSRAQPVGWLARVGALVDEAERVVVAELPRTLPLGRGAHASAELRDATTTGPSGPERGPSRTLIALSPSPHPRE